MTILDEIIDTIQEDAPVTSVLMGIYWTLVITPRGSGMAATFGNIHAPGKGKIRGVGTFEEMSTRSLVEYSRSENPLEASLGIAALNALICPQEPAGIELNAFDVLVNWGRDRQVVMVGHFPFARRLRPQVGNLWVLEKDPEEDDIPADRAYELIPQADVVAITGSSLINHTLDGLLKLCKKDARVIILGPSTPLSPVLFDHGAKLISGVQVTDPSLVYRTISQGADFQQVEGVRLVTVKPDGLSKLEVEKH